MNKPKVILSLLFLIFCFKSFGQIYWKPRIYKDVKLITSKVYFGDLGCNYVKKEFVNNLGLVERSLIDISRSEKIEEIFTHNKYGDIISKRIRSNSDSILIKYHYEYDNSLVTSQIAVYNGKDTFQIDKKRMTETEILSILKKTYLYELSIKNQLVSKGSKKNEFKINLCAAQTGCPRPRPGAFFTISYKYSNEDKN